MHPLATHPTPGRARIAVLLLGAAFIAACNDQTITEPPLLPAANVTAMPNPNFFVTVYRPDGAVMQNATVTVLSSSGSPLSLLTDVNGTASFQVPNGRYCVVARVIPVGSPFPTFLPALDHPGMINPAMGPKPAGAVLTSGNSVVPFSPAAYQNCYGNPSVRVNGPSTSFSITLLEGPQLTLNTGTYAGTQAGGMLASLIIPIATPPWASTEGIPSDVKPGFYASGFYAQDGLFTFVLPKNYAPSSSNPFYIELQKEIDTGAGSAWITLTARMSQAVNAVMPVEPLFCDITNGVVTDTNTPRSGTDLHVYKHAYLAEASATALTLLPNAWGSQLSFSGAGSFSQDIRFRLDNGTTIAKINISATSTTCSASSSAGFVAVFCARVGDRFYLTTVVPVLPAGTNQVESSISTSSGEQFPVSSKNGPKVSSAFLRTDLPASSSCPLDRSNDDKWFVF